MTTHTHADLIAHRDRLRLALRMAPSPEVFTFADSIVAVCDALEAAQAVPETHNEQISPDRAIKARLPVEVEDSSENAWPRRGTTSAEGLGRLRAISEESVEPTEGLRKLMLTHPSEGKATEGEAPFEIGCTVKLKDADLVGTLLEFNEPITGALIRWSHNGDEIWKALRNLEVVSQPSEGEGPGEDYCPICAVADLPAGHIPGVGCIHADPPAETQAQGGAPEPYEHPPGEQDGPARSSPFPITREAVARVIDPDAWWRAGALEQREGVPKAESHYVANSLAKADAVLALLQPLAGREWQPTHRHVKRGTTYATVNMSVQLQTDKPLGDYAILTVYQDEHGNWWARPTAEFTDPDRFEPILQPSGS